MVNNTQNNMNISNIELKKGILHDFNVCKESCKFTGYTLFLSFFYLECKSLTEQGRLDELGFDVNEDWRVSDDDSIDSLAHISNVNVI